MIYQQYILLLVETFRNIDANLAYYDCNTDLSFYKLRGFFDIVMLSIIRFLELCVDIYLQDREHLSIYFFYNVLCNLITLRRDNKIKFSIRHLGWISALPRQHQYMNITSPLSRITYGKAHKYILKFTSLNEPKYFVYYEEKALSHQRNTINIIKNITNYIVKHKEKGFFIMLIFTLYSYHIISEIVKSIDKNVVNVSKNIINKVYQRFVSELSKKTEKYRIIELIIHKNYNLKESKMMLESFKKRFM